MERKLYTGYYYIMRIDRAGIRRAARLLLDDAINQQEYFARVVYWIFTGRVTNPPHGWKPTS